jgi:uncharacterized RDD family membrane protein YckC
LKQNVKKSPGFWLITCSVVIDLAAIWLLVLSVANIAASFGLYIPIEFSILVLYALYNVICQLIWSCTLGQWACEIKVVRRNGQRIGYLASSIRALVQTLSLLLLGLPFLAVAVRRDKRGWHDLLAGTEVQFMTKPTTRKRWAVATVGIFIAFWGLYQGYAWIYLFSIHHAFTEDANKIQYHSSDATKNRVEVSSLDERRLDEISAWLEKNQKDPAEYLVRFASQHQVTIVGEVHGKKPFLEFLNRIIPDLYHNAGVRVIALECCRGDQDAQLRKLVTADKFDETLLLEIARDHPWHAWGYEEHWRVLESVWKLNQSLPRDSELMHVVGIFPAIDLISFRMLTEGHVLRLFHLLNDLPLLFMHDAFYARCVERQAFDLQRRTLVWVGASHALQCQSSQRSRNDQSRRYFRMGAMLYGRYRQQVGSILLHNEFSFEGIAQLLERCPVVREKKQIGFTIADSPLGHVYDNASPHTKYGKVELPFEAFFTGYIVVAPLEEIIPCPWWKDYINRRMFGLYKPFYEKLCERKLRDYKEANRYMEEGVHRL